MVIAMQEPPQPQVPSTLPLSPPGLGQPTGGPPRMIGRYTIIREVARGGMGAVLLAWDPHLRVQRAIKVLLAEDLGGAEATERFLREARVLARLAHPNIIPVLEAGYDGPHPYLVLPFVEGGALTGLLQARGGRLPHREAAELVDRVARAIDFAHGEGVVHRDLKPANVLLDRAGAPLVTDFGIARDGAAQERLTQTGQLMGTPSYMPPEQAAGEQERVGPRSDVYSLGAILYELLAGQPPFSGGTPIQTLRAILEDPPPPLRSLRPDVPADLEAIVAQAMAKEPDERYDSAAALAADLRRFLQDLPVAARSLSAGARLWRGARRHVVASSLVALAALLAVVGGGVLGVDRWQADRRREARALLLRAEEARRDGRVDEAGPLLALASARDPDSGPVRQALVELALARGDLPGATSALDELLAVAGEAEASTRRLAGEVEEAHGRDEPAIAAYREALRLDPRDDASRLRLAALLARRGLHGEAEAALEGLATTEAARVRATCLAARGARWSAEEAWWSVLRDDVEAPDALGAIVSARLERDDVVGLARLWEEVHRRLAAPGEPSLQALSHGDLAAVTSDLLAGAPARRVRAALAAPVFHRAELVSSLGALAWGDPSPLVREAALAGLLSIERTTLEVFAGRARALEAPADAGAALTLLERAPLLAEADEGALLSLASARSPLVRAALALALATAATRAQGLPIPRALALLDRLSRDGEPLVVGRAAAARAALQAFRGDADPAGLALALALTGDLARRSDDVVPVRAGLLAALEQVLAAGPTARLLVARATDALERWRLEEARRDVERALELAPEDDAALALRHLLARMSGDAAGATRALDLLRARDPRAADEAARRAGLAEEHDAVVLPAANGAVALVVVPRERGPWRRPGPSGVDAAFFVLSSHRRFDDDALVVEGPSILRGRFGLAEVHTVDVDLTQGDGTAAQVELALQRAASAGLGRHVWLSSHPGNVSSLTTDDSLGARWPSIGPGLVGVRVGVRRGGVEVRTRAGDGEPRETCAVADSLAVRRDRAEGGLDLEVGWTPGAHRLRRIVVLGRFTDASPYPPLPERRALEPAPGSLPLRANRVLQGRVPGGLATLADLTRGAMLLPLGPGAAALVGGAFDAPIVDVSGLRGDVLVRAKVAFNCRSDQGAGICLRRTNGDDRVLLAIGGPQTPWEPEATGSVGVFTQRERAWEDPIPLRGYPGSSPVVLELERRGSWIVARSGSTAEDVRPLASFYFPLDGPVDVCFVARSTNNTNARTARFEDVEVLVEPPLRGGVGGR
jgi:tetratricopeptide (TPR) repeat protein